MQLSSFVHGIIVKRNRLPFFLYDGIVMNSSEIKYRNVVRENKQLQLRIQRLEDELAFYRELFLTNQQALPPMMSLQETQDKACNKLYRIDPDNPNKYCNI